MIGCPGCAEEVRLRAGRNDQVVGGQRPAMLDGDGGGISVDRAGNRTSYVDAGGVMEDPVQGPGYVVCRDLRGRHLVEQRLELVVVVLVEQDHVNVVFCQLLSARDACEAAADYQDSGISHRSMEPASVEPHIPRSG